MKKIFYRIYNQLFKESTQINNNLRSYNNLNIFKTLKDKRVLDFLFNGTKRNQINLLNDTKGDEILKNAVVPITTNMNNNKFSATTSSGLKDFSQQYLTGNSVFQAYYKQCFLIQQGYILYIMARFNMDNDDAVVKNISKFFCSIIPCLHNISNYNDFRKIYLSNYMGNLQHLLVLYFRYKKFNPSLLKKYLLEHLDYNMFKYCTILNLIELFVCKKTLKELLEKNSFVAINHESPLLNEPASILGYNCTISLLKAGQLHVDFINVRAIVDSNGNIELIVWYKDVKMFESGIDKGRLSVKPDLAHNERYLKEYLSKNITTLQKVVKENGLKEDHPCSSLLQSLLDQQSKINNIVFKAKKNIIGDYLKEEDLLKIKCELKIFNDMILKGMDDLIINKCINMGISEDPGRNNDFELFFKEYLKASMPNLVKNMDDECFSSLHSSTITKKTEEFLGQTQKEIIAMFPEQLADGFPIKENVLKAIEYLHAE